MATIKVSQLTNDECKWYGVPIGSFRLNSNEGWFPTEDIMGVINGKFSDTHQIGATISGSMGSRNMAVVDLDKSLELLKQAGHDILR